ncbi:hypothetical protein [Chitinilyticum litopenaei]|uniref:hypothetical protein n=1 Tax=Chitinilyticum litopenaei TaxID=1121276 RepID=UPI00048C6019|nr:hypothetical protein [Chitinilyticum litopenaei]
MRNWLRTLLFITAFSPALLSIAWVKYDAHSLTSEVITLAIVGVIGSALPFLVLRLVERQGEFFTVDIKKVEQNDFMLLAFVGSYILPFLLRAADLSVGSISSVLIVLFVILWLINSLPAHPLLRMLRFRFYKVESSSGVVYTLISRREILEPKQIKSVKKISGAMLMEVY